MVDGTFEPGFLVYGVPVGTDAHTLMEKVREVEEKVRSCCRVLGQERQALWTTLKLSVSQTFDYWLQLVYPSQIPGRPGEDGALLLRGEGGVPLDLFPA